MLGNVYGLHGEKIQFSKAHNIKLNSLVSWFRTQQIYCGLC